MLANNLVGCATTADAQPFVKVRISIGAHASSAFGPPHLTRKIAGQKRLTQMVYRGCYMLLCLPPRRLLSGGYSDASPAIRLDGLVHPRSRIGIFSVLAV